MLKTILALIAEYAVVYFVSGQLAPNEGLSWEWAWKVLVFVILLIMHDAYVRYDMIKEFKDAKLTNLEPDEIVERMITVPEQTVNPDKSVFEEEKASILIAIKKDDKNDKPAG